MKLSTICLAAFAAFGPAAALAYSGQGIPNPRYPDGTGNDAIEQLNNAQLDQNYHGPVYYRGQQPPEAAPTQLAAPPAYPQPAYAQPAYPQPAYPPAGTGNPVQRPQP